MYAIKSLSNDSKWYNKKGNQEYNKIANKTLLFSKIKYSGKNLKNACLKNILKKRYFETCLKDIFKFLFSI